MDGDIGKAFGKNSQLTSFAILADRDALLSSTPSSN